MSVPYPHCYCKLEQPESYGSKKRSCCWCGQRAELDLVPERVSGHGPLRTYMLLAIRPCAERERLCAGDSQTKG